jgi:hypothetical protein
MSETKLTRYDWGKEGVVVNPNGDYYDKGDADARIAALERDLTQLREAALGEHNLRLTAERDLAAANVTLGQAQSDLVGLRGRLATAERERDELRKRVEVLEKAAKFANQSLSDCSQRGELNMGVELFCEIQQRLFAAITLRTPPAAPDDDELEATDTEQHFKPCYCGGMMYKWDPTQLYRDSTDPICWRCVKCKTTSPLTAAQGAQP